MPTYTYKCPVHGELEVEQRITDPKLTTCPLPDARSRAERHQEFNGAGGALRWGHLPFSAHPDRCVCQGDDAYPHRHYKDRHMGCARCVCVGYTPAFTPTCGQPVERLISTGTTFTLKGPGWAKDGYR